MKEKKFNEEEIVKGLCCMAGQRPCDLCKYDELATQEGERTCMNLVAEDTLELLYQKDETIAEQKAEIERLTEENGQLKGYNNGLEYENAELQKQVDELKEYADTTYKKAVEREEDAYSLGFDNGKEQAVKDTAKEILGVILAKEFEKGDYLTDDELHEIFKERYGVEVDE